MSASSATLIAILAGLGVADTEAPTASAPRFGTVGLAAGWMRSQPPDEPPATPDPDVAQSPDGPATSDGGTDPAQPDAPKDPDATDSPPTDPPVDPADGSEPTVDAPSDPPPADPPPSDPPPSDPPPADSSATQTSPDADKPDGGGGTSMDDIFGTPEENTAVEVVSEDPESTDATPAAAAPDGGGTTKTAGQRFLSNLDTRFRIVSSVYYDVHRVEERGFGRNENRLEFYFSYSPNRHLQIVGDVEPVFFGVSQTQELDDLATRQMLTPFHVESDAAYIAVNDLLPNLDLKVGRQTVVWGTADKFNPTNNINSDDLEDRPLFTEPIANQMVVVDYAPLDDKLWFQGVYVPLFYPALLPPSAAAGLTDPQSPVPFARESDEAQIAELQDLLDVQAGLVPTVTSTVVMPKRRFSDGQSAVKIGSSLGGVDFSVSYYNGRHDIPTPVRADAATKDPTEGPATEAECCFTSHVTLVYPRMQVLGFDFATELPFLGNMGLWGEGALFFPGQQDLIIEFPITIDVTPDDGLVNPVDSVMGPGIRSNPFIKATAGVDYTFGKHVYVQGQYLRGFIDEFGVDHIGNYLVGGTELIFFGRHLIFRLFGVVDLPTDLDDNESYVIYPALAMTPPWGSVTFELGSFFLIGENDTKFGQRAAGSSIVFFKVTGTF